MSQTSLIYKNEKHAKTQPRVLRFTYTLTSGALSPIQTGYPVLALTGATTQAVIDAFLGNSSDINYLNFDATSLGTDAMGFIVDMQGQAKSIEYAMITMRSGTGNLTTVHKFATATEVLVNTQLAVVECAVSTAGNLSCRCVIASLDSTTGYVTVEIGWVSK